MINIIRNYKYQILLWIFILIYIIYFSFLTITRSKTLYASYFDLGIMNQTVYNTYKGLAQHDYNRILELTDVDGSAQIKRMAIHNDLLLLPISLFYFIHAGPETLLILQTIVLALGAVAVFKISQKVFEKNKHKDLLSFIFGTAYLLYPPLQFSNHFDFHAVTLATSFLLFMFYFWLIKKYFLSFIFFILAILSKEQVALTTSFFGLYCLCSPKIFKQIQNNKKNLFFSIAIITVSIIWFVISMSYIIPLFRGRNHFAISYYGDFGDTPIGVIIGILTNPYSVVGHLFRKETYTYLFQILGPLGFLSILSPIQLLIALPELAINLLSNDVNMKNIYYHYSAVITPFVFIGGIYGMKRLLEFKTQNLKVKDTIQKSKVSSVYLILIAILFSYLYGPLVFTKSQEIHPFKFPQKEAKDVEFWAKTLKNENLKIASTGQLAPFFTSRRYFYNFSVYYYLADYVVLRPNEIYNYPDKDKLIPVYEKLKRDKNYKIIYQKDNIEVYKKI